MDKTYINAKRNQSEGMSHTQTSCITCKFKPDYMAAIPCLREAADAFFGFSKSKPDLYKQSLVMEEAVCREKLIVCYDKESSLSDAGEQGIKLAKLYINYLRSFDLAYRTMENFNMSLIQSSSVSGNNNIQRALKGISEIAKCFTEQQDAADNANKTYLYLFETACSVFPGQVKENEPYEYIYTAFADYFDSLITRKEFEMLLRDVLKVIELVSPSNAQLLQRESVMGKDNEIENILKLYYKVLVCCVCMEDQEKFDFYASQANELKSDCTHGIILDSLREVFAACLNGEEKSYNRNSSILDSILSIPEAKELRSIMRKYKKYEREDEAPKSVQNTVKYADKYFDNNYKEKPNEFVAASSNSNIRNLAAVERIDLGNIKGQMQNINKGFNQNFEKLNQLNDIGQEFKKLNNTNADLMRRHTGETTQIKLQNQNLNHQQPQPDVNERQKKYQINEEDEEQQEEKNFVVNLDHEGNHNEQQKLDNKSPVYDYL